MVSPDDTRIPLAVRLNFPLTNNTTEYEACISGLEAALELGVKRVEIFGDSNLIISQARGDWRVREERLKPYHEKLEKVRKQFTEISFYYLPRIENQFADSLATLASMIEIPLGVKMRPLIIEQRDEPVYCNAITEEEEDEELPWYTDIQRYVERQEYPEGASEKDKRAIRRLSAQYVMIWGKLYRRSYLGLNLLCLKKSKAERVMEQVHAGVCGPHMNGHTLAKKIVRVGYFWTTMERDCCELVKRCHKCQIHANLMHAPPIQLQNMTSPWPFSAWGIDIIGKITPASSGGHNYILVAIDYFTKWVEAAAYVNLTSRDVAKFLKYNIICRYGVPHEIVSDNGSHFKKEVLALLNEYHIKLHKSAPYRPKTNGAVESANKNIKSMLRKMMGTYKDWQEKLPFALWGYRTTVRTSTGATPYSLVYGMEAVLPIEVEVPSLRVLAECKVDEGDWLTERFEELALIDEKRLIALNHVQGYQKRIARAYNKKVRPRKICEGDLVLKEMKAPVYDPRGKFKPNWLGPYIVKIILPGGAAYLMDLDGHKFVEPTNLDFLKKYYA